MTQAQVLKRQIQLKRQAIPLIRREITDLQIRLALLVLKGRLEEQIGEDFDPKLSKQLDAVIFLLEN